MTKFRASMETLVASGPITEIDENLCKLEAMLADYRKYKTPFEDVIDHLLQKADDTQKSYARMEKDFLDEV